MSREGEANKAAGVRSKRRPKGEELLGDKNNRSREAGSPMAKSPQRSKTNAEMEGKRGSFGRAFVGMLRSVGSRDFCHTHKLRLHITSLTLVENDKNINKEINN